MSPVAVWDGGSRAGRRSINAALVTSAKRMATAARPSLRRAQKASMR
jgi:hypothetical protein